MFNKCESWNEVMAQLNARRGENCLVHTIKYDHEGNTMMLSIYDRLQIADLSMNGVIIARVDFELIESQINIALNNGAKEIMVF